MKEPTYDLVVTVQREIAAPPETVYDSWLSAEVPGTVWNAADEYVLDAKVGGLFYWLLDENAHYGRFTALTRAKRIEHTWVSPSTLGEESKVSITFKKKGAGTVMTLVHSGLPNNERGKGHERGWNYFLGIFPGQFVAAPRKRTK
ncbi:MAG: SRPBCC domain-containing protein [Opitutaceae bacterium]|nr:SRPBCC domain-containing protein [Opitutaceae bacterium]